jgi:hypothetical protein
LQYEIALLSVFVFFIIGNKKLSREGFVTSEERTYVSRLFFVYSMAISDKAI